MKFFWEDYDTQINGKHQNRMLRMLIIKPAIAHAFESSLIIPIRHTISEASGKTINMSPTRVIIGEPHPKPGMPTIEAKITIIMLTHGVKAKNKPAFP